MRPAAFSVQTEPLNPLLAAGGYLVDAAQRGILFWDVLRRRGNQYLEHLAQGQPPVLVFDYETILDGRSLERPVNYALVRILDRRCRPPACDRGLPADPSGAAAAPRYDRRHPAPGRSSSSTRAPATARASAAPSRIPRSAWPWMPGTPSIS